jgi:glycine hydroxymethyltransferase
MAQGIMKARWESTGRHDCISTSMGVHGMDALPPTDLAVQVCMENGIDISKIRSRPLVAEELKTAEFIFAMEPFQKEYLRVFFPQCMEQLHLLGSYPDRKDSKKHIVKDPVGGTIKDYRKAFASLAEHIDRILPILQNDY